MDREDYKAIEAGDAEMYADRVWGWWDIRGGDPQPYMTPTQMLKLRNLMIEAIKDAIEHAFDLGEKLGKESYGGQRTQEDEDG